LTSSGDSLFLGELPTFGEVPGEISTEILGGYSTFLETLNKGDKNGENYEN